MRYEPGSGVHLWPALAAALDGGTAGLAGGTAALAFERLLSVALLLSHPPAGAAGLAFASDPRLPAGTPSFRRAAVLARLIARRRR
ncbi:MAG TPA: hypothetical protein VNM43_00225 [Dehalococcoidia bacterium]|nr:hypothetical protein [Dehalococcoidia bacterium]